MSLRRFLLLAAVLLTSASGAAEAPISNRLSDHPSPYLAMHGNDPVHWQVWSEAVFARAARENKLVFVSSGYFSCHWCHVMQRESYLDPAIAAYINTHFIPVKIDRELLPAVDAGLIDFVERTRGQAGWPLNVFLTPAGHPLIGILYLPPKTFQSFVDNLVQRWKAEPTQLADMAKSAAEATAVRPSAQTDQRKEPVQLAPLLRQQALAMADELAGGFGEQNKFPMTPQLLALLDVQARDPNEQLAEFLRLTLDQMAARGLRDHLGGGFFRYTVDPTWRTPHYEKMLYDNALLARVYLRAADVLSVPAYRDIARETVDFVIDTLSAPGGGYYAALSAVDDAGVEGGYYLWDREELQRLAGDDWPLLERYWGLDAAAADPSGELLMPAQSVAELAHAVNKPVADVERIVAAMKDRLIQQRFKRSVPVDTKVLAGWNGLLLTALVDAAAQLEAGRSNGRFTLAAAKLRSFILEHFVSGDALVRARADGAPLGAAGLEDYAYVIAGLQRWHEVFGSAQAADGVRIDSLLTQAWARFHGERGWRQGEDVLLQWGSGEPAIADGPMPAPSALLMAASHSAPETSKRLRAALALALPAVERQPFWHASYIGLYR